MQYHVPINRATAQTMGQIMGESLLQYGMLLKTAFKHPITGVVTTAVHMDDTTHETLEDAVREAYGFMNDKDSSILGVFSVDLSTGEIKQVYDRRQLEAEADEYYHTVIVTPEERAERAYLDAYNFRHDTTL